MPALHGAYVAYKYGTPGDPTVTNQSIFKVDILGIEGAPINMFC